MSPQRSLQIFMFGAALLGLAACSSGSTSTIAGVPGNGSIGNGALCDPGTQVQLANPPNGNVSVPTNFSPVVIVANGNSNTLYTNYTQWNLILNDNFGNSIQGGPLSLVSFKQASPPYPSDFYYASSISGLIPGRTYNVFLNLNANCQPSGLGAFAT